MRTNSSEHQPPGRSVGTGVGISNLSARLALSQSCSQYIIPAWRHTALSDQVESGLNVLSMLIMWGGEGKGVEAASVVFVGIRSSSRTVPSRPECSILPCRYMGGLTSVWAGFGLNYRSSLTAREPGGAS